MLYELKKCSICGSEELKIVDKEYVGLDTYLVYKCNSCDSVVSHNKIKEEIKDTSKENFKSKDIGAVSIFDKNSKNVYSVECFINDEDKSTGTAFTVGSNGYLLTNAHIVTRISSEEESFVNFEVNEDITVKSVNNEIFDCELIDIDLKLDLALLKINKKNLSCISLGSYADVKTGERVVSIGNSKGEGLCISEGLVGDRARNLTKQTKILISVPVNQGSSGGPLFNMKGQVIGVVTSWKKDAVAMNYAVPVDEVVKFIRRIEKEQEIKVIN